VPRRRTKKRNLPAISVEVSGADTRHLENQSEKFQLHYNKLIFEMAIQRLQTESSSWPRALHRD
jgi:hypothetical protein